MNILAFDTSTTACSVALGRVSNAGEVDVRAHVFETDRDSREKLPSMIRILLSDTATDLNDIDVMAFGQGPGAFIGVRVTAAVAQAFAYAKTIPLVGVSSLAIVAQMAFDKSDAEKVLSVIDARKGELYYGYYCRDNGGAVLESDEGLQAFENIPGVQEFEGECWGNYDDALVGRIGAKISHYETNVLPDARAMLTLAFRYAQNKQWQTPAQAHPVYMRNKVTN